MQEFIFADVKFFFRENLLSWMVKKIIFRGNLISRINPILISSNIVVTIVIVVFALFNVGLF